MKGLIPGAYAELLQGTKGRVCSARYAASKAVNREMIALYWDIRRMIVERQKVDNWGNAVVERLAADLGKDLRGMQGFFSSNFRGRKISFQI